MSQTETTEKVLKKIDKSKYGTEVLVSKKIHIFQWVMFLVRDGLEFAFK